MKTSIMTAGKLPVISVTQSLKQIRKLHGEIFQAVRTSLPKAVKIGELLTGLKDKMDHGEWLPWIQKNLPFSDRTAARYIKCFSERDRLGKFDSVTNLTDAYELLSEPKAAPRDNASFAEMDARFKQSTAEIKNAFADFPKGDLPSGLIDKSAFERLVELGDLPLSEDDEIGLLTLGSGFDAGARFTLDTIFETLRRFNPAREMEAA